MGGRQSKLVLVGLAGGTLKFTAGLVNELEVTTSSWGSISAERSPFTSKDG
jgi:alcohol dehydrogenase, propanol-preferring